MSDDLQPWVKAPEEKEPVKDESEELNGLIYYYRFFIDDKFDEHHHFNYYKTGKDPKDVLLVLVELLKPFERLALTSVYRQLIKDKIRTRKEFKTWSTWELNNLTYNPAQPIWSTDIDLCTDDSFHIIITLVSTKKKPEIDLKITC